MRVASIVLILLFALSANTVYAAHEVGAQHHTVYLPVLWSPGRGVIGPGPDPAQVGKALYAPTLKAMPPPSFAEVKAFIDRTGKGEYGTRVIQQDGISVTVQDADLDIGRMSKAELNSLRLYLPEVQAAGQDTSGARLVLCPPGHPAWIALLIFGRGLIQMTIIVFNRGEEFVIPATYPIRYGARVFWIPAVDTPRAEISSIRWDTGDVFAFDYAGGCFWMN